MKAQGAAYAPFFIDVDRAAFGLKAKVGVERQGRACTYGGKALDALLASGLALVDGRAVVRDGLGVSTAIGVAAALTLGLWQGCINGLRKRSPA